MKILKVTFEMVHPVANPQFYCGCGEHPASDPLTIPDVHWKPVETVSEPTGQSRMGVVDQYRNLLVQESEGELIRNVRLWEADEPVWVVIANVTPAEWKPGQQ